MSLTVSLAETRFARPLRDGEARALSFAQLRALQCGVEKIIIFC
jgi:hypothetical protein